NVASDGTQADEGSFRATLSADGRFAAFESVATNLAPGDTNGISDIFVHDRLRGATERVSVASDGSQTDGTSDWPSISAEGRYVAFVSDAPDLVVGDTNAVADVFVHDLLTGMTTRVSVATDGTQTQLPAHGAVGLSPDGHYVAFTSASPLVPPDTNGVDD